MVLQSMTKVELDCVFMPKSMGLISVGWLLLLRLFYNGLFHDQLLILQAKMTMTVESMASTFGFKSCLLFWGHLTHLEGT
jgi:hypothetical protein